jgi:hypothetical protein
VFATQVAALLIFVYISMVFANSFLICQLNAAEKFLRSVLTIFSNYKSYVFRKNSKLFKFLLFTGLENFFSSEIVLILGSLILFILAVYITLRVWFMKIRPKNREALKRFQVWCENYQNGILLVLLTVSFFFCWAITPLEEALFGLVFFCCGGTWVYLYLLVFPGGLPYIFGLLMVLRIPMGTVNYPLCLVLLVMFLMHQTLSTLNIKNPAALFVKEVKEYQNDQESHKKSQFYLWSFIEKYNYVTLFLLALFSVHINSVDSSFMTPIKLYSSLFLIYSSVINLIVICAFNPPKEVKLVLAVATACAGCVAGASGSYLAYEAFDERSLGGVKDPGDSPIVAWHQKRTVGCTMPTAEHVRAQKTHSFVYGCQAPLVTRTALLDLAQTREKLLNETNPVIQEKIVFHDIRYANKFPQLKKK